MPITPPLSVEDNRFPNPFPGPVALCEGYPVFGRDEEIANLQGLLFAEHVVVLHGVSGAGKSSLLRGQDGIRDRFVREKHFSVLGPIEFRLPDEGGGEDFYEKFLLELLNKQEPEERQHEIQEIWSDMDLEMFLIRRANRIGCIYQLLILDQFEDLFTHFPHDTAGKVAFFHSLGEILERNPNIRLLLAMREEYLGELDHFRKYMPGRLQTTFRLELLSKAQATEAIIKTANSSQQKIKLCTHDVEVLVDNLSQITVCRGGGQETQTYQTGSLVEPLFLQLACRDAWQQEVQARPTGAAATDDGCVPLTHGATRGALDDVLARFYDSSIAIVCREAGSEEFKIRSLIQDGLISSKGLRTLLSVDQAHSEWGVSKEQLQDLVEQHLIRLQDRNLVSYYELAHDRLVNPVKAKNEAWLSQQPAWRQSARLRNLGSDKTGLGLSQLLHAWKTRRHTPNALTPFEHRFVDEQKQEVMRRYASFAFFSIVVVVLLIILAEMTRQAEDNKQKTEVVLADSEKVWKDNVAKNKEISVKRQLGKYTAYKWGKLDDQESVLQVVLAYVESRKEFPEVAGQQQFAGALFTAFNNSLTKLGNAPGFSRSMPTLADMKESPVAFYAGKEPLMAYLHNESRCLVVRELRSGKPRYDCLQRVDEAGARLQFNPKDENGGLLALSYAASLVIYDVEKGAGAIKRIPEKSNITKFEFSADGEVLAYAAANQVELLCRSTNWEPCGSLVVPMASNGETIGALGISEEFDSGRTLAVGINGVVKNSAGVKGYTGVVSLWRFARASGPGGSLEHAFSVPPKQLHSFASPRPMHEQPIDKQNVIALGFLSRSPKRLVPERLVIVHEDTQIYLATQSSPPTGGFDHLQVKPDRGSQANGARAVLDNDQYSSVAFGPNDHFYRVLNDTIEEWDFGGSGAPPSRTDTLELPVLTSQTGARDLKDLTVGHDFLIGQGFFNTWIWELGGGPGSKLVVSEIPGVPAAIPGDRRFYPQALAFVSSADLVAGTSQHGLQYWQPKPNGGWSVRPLNHCSKVKGVASSVRAIAVSSDRKLIAAAYGDKQLMVVNLDQPDRVLLCDDQRHTADLWSVAFSHDGKWLVSGDRKGKLNLWQIEYGKDGKVGKVGFVRDISVAGDRVMALAFSPKLSPKHKNLLAIGMFSGEVQLLTVTDAGEAGKSDTGEFQQGPLIGAILSLGFSHDGRQLAAAGARGPIKIWWLDKSSVKAPDGKEVPHLLEGHAGGTRSVAFNPHNDLLASGGVDGLVKIWNINGLQGNPASLRSLDAGVLAVAWDIEGTRLASGFKLVKESGLGSNNDGPIHGRILIWSWELDAFAKIACEAVWSGVLAPARKMDNPCDQLRQ